MTKHKKKFTDRQLLQRAAIEEELSQIEPICKLARKITTSKGFVDYFLRMRELYDTHLDAYERLEDFHIDITGHRRYAEFSSFRMAIKRNLL